MCSVGRCIVYTGIRHPFISSSHFFQELWGLEDWNLVRTWTVGGCILYTGIRHPFISSFFFLSNFQSLKFFVTLFSGTVKPRRLKLGAHVDSGWLYRLYQNQAAAAYLTHLFLHLSLQFSNIKTFRQTFLRNCEAKKIETWYARGQWADVYCIPESGILLSLPFQSLQFFVILFSGTVGPRRLKLGTRVDSGQMYRV